MLAAFEQRRQRGSIISSDEISTAPPAVIGPSEAVRHARSSPAPAAPSSERQATDPHHDAPKRQAVPGPTAAHICKSTALVALDDSPRPKERCRCRETKC